ncbi:MAG: PilW family protein [Chitinivibrionales bacterium]
MKKNFKDKSDSGYTLTELMLYILVSSFVVFSIFYLINTTATGFVNSRRKSMTQSSGRDAISVMARDIKNAGFRHYISPVTSSVEEVSGIEQSNGESLNYGDSASHSGMGDTLVFWKAILNSAEDTVSERQRITYKLDSDNKILRLLYDLDNNTTDTAVILENTEVMEFQFTQDFNTWEDAPAQSDLSYIKGVKIILVVRSRNQGTTDFSKRFPVGNSDTITFNDSYIRRRYEETVPVYNNYIEN